MSNHPMPLREQAGRLFRALRGTAGSTAAAQVLGVAHPRVHRLEAGSLSLDGMDKIAAAYGVELHLIAADATGATSNTWNAQSAVDGDPAPGIAAALTAADTPDAETAV